MELSGKTALVTGASRGIGAAMALRLARTGAHVAVNYAGSRDAAEALVAEIEGAGGKAFAVQADVGTMAGVETMLAACDAVFGGTPNLDILVNNAGVGGEGDAGSLTKCTEELFDRMIAVNQKARISSPSLRCRAFAMVAVSSTSARSVVALRCRLSPPMR